MNLRMARSQILCMLWLGTFVEPGLFRVQFNAVSGRRYIIEASADLQTWTAIHTNSASTDVFEYAETPSAPRRFYRARTGQ